MMKALKNIGSVITTRKSFSVMIHCVLLLIALSGGLQAAGWTKMENTSFTGNLYDVWAISDDNVFAVGDSGTILRYDGNRCNVMESGTVQVLREIWGSSANNLFVVGDEGTILRYDGNRWETMESGTNMGFRGIWGTSATDVFAFGNGEIFHYDGIRWTRLPNSNGNYSGAWGTLNNIFFTDYSGIIKHYDGNALITVKTETDIRFDEIWGRSANDIFAFGNKDALYNDQLLGYVYHYDGNTWTKNTTDFSFVDVWGTSSYGSKMFGIGYNFYGGGYEVLHSYDGINWTKSPGETDFYTNSVSGYSENGVFAVGTFGEIFYYPGNYTISGTITDSANQPLEGIRVNFKYGDEWTSLDLVEMLSYTVLTDSTGAYSKTVKGDWWGKVVPELEGYQFLPGNPSYSDLTEDQTQDYKGTSYVGDLADTIILTNISKFSEDTEDLKAAIQELVETTWEVSGYDDDNLSFPQGFEGYKKYNMLPIVVDLGDEDILEGGAAKHPCQASSASVSKDASAVEIVGFLRNLKSKQGYKGLKYLVLVGTHDQVPLGTALNYMKEFYGSSWHEREKYSKFEDLGKSLEPLYSDGVSQDHFQWSFLEDPCQGGKRGWFSDAVKWVGKTVKKVIIDPILNFFTPTEYCFNYGPFSTYPSDRIYRMAFSTGRLVEEPSHIAGAIRLYIRKEGYVLTSKNALYMGGHDSKDKSGNYKTGFPISLALKNNTFGEAWKEKKIHKPKSGFDGKEVVREINRLGSGIVFLGGHGHHNICINSEDYLPYYAGGKPFQKDNTTALGSLENTIILTNSCLTGVSYSSADGRKTDFPEAYVNNASLPVYIAQFALGAYVPAYETKFWYWDGIIPKMGKKVEALPSMSEKIYYEATKKLLEGDVHMNIYDAFFRLPPYEPILSESEDLMSRPQFYGIPNYRLGPKYSKRRDDRTGRDVSVSNDIGSEFVNKEIRSNENGISMDIVFDMKDNYRFNTISGLLTVYGCDNKDRYNRPLAALLSFPIPEGSDFESWQIVDEQTEIQTYTDDIATEACNSFTCTGITFETEDFDDIQRVDAIIRGETLFVRFYPVQYKTKMKEAKISKMLKVRLDISFPEEALPDGDSDNLPDYWENAHGLDPRIPGGDDGPDGDPDKDGITNLEEFNNHTNPLVEAVIESDTTPPAAPLGLSVTPVENGAEITLTSDADTAYIQLSYGMYRDALIQSTSQQLAEADSFLIRGLEDSTDYYVTARAFDKAGNMSAASEIISFRTPAGAGPNLPGEPVLDGDTLVITNPTDPDFQGYEFDFGNKSDMSDADKTFISADEGTETRIHLPDYIFKPGNMYVQVSATDENNHNGPASKIINVGEIIEAIEVDIDQNGVTELRDAILALKVITGKIRSNGKRTGSARSSRENDFEKDDPFIKEILFLRERALEGFQDQKDFERFREVLQKLSDASVDDPEKRTALLNEITSIKHLYPNHLSRVRSSRQTDSTLPELKSLEITPIAIDVTGGEKEITFTATAEDNGSGVSDVTIWLDRDMPNGYSFVGIWSDWEDGQASETYTFPTYGAPGEYNIEKITVENNDWEERTYDAIDLAAMGIPMKFSVTSNGSGDNTPPELKSFAITPTVADISTGAKDITFTVTAEDDLSGVNEALIRLDRDLPDGYSFVGLWFGWEGGQNSSTETFPGDSTPAEYTIEEITIEDNAQNPRTYDANALEAMGFPIRFSVTSGGGPGPEAPTANAGSDQNAEEGDKVTLDGSGSSDSSGVLTYLWEQQSGTSVTLSDTGTVYPFFAAPDVGTSGETLTFRLTVTNGSGLQSSDTVAIHVSDAGTASVPPTADAGSDQNAEEGDKVTLDGSGSSDPSGVLTYLWEQQSGTSVRLSDTGSVYPFFAAPDVGTSGETLTFRLAVTNGSGLQSSDTVMVFVSDTEENISITNVDINGDGRIGLEEVIFILWMISGY